MNLRVAWQKGRFDQSTDFLPLSLWTARPLRRWTTLEMALATHRSCTGFGTRAEREYVAFFFRRERAGTHERTQLARLPTREIISALRQRYTTRRISISGTGSNSRRNLNFAADRAFSPASTDALCFPFLLVVRASLLLYFLLILRFPRSAASRVFPVSLISWSSS